jgi:hypothetical protein
MAMLAYSVTIEGETEVFIGKDISMIMEIIYDMPEYAGCDIDCIELIGPVKAKR